MGAKPQSCKAHASGESPPVGFQEVGLVGGCLGGRLFREGRRKKCKSGRTKSIRKAD